jgi:hypothetical protein
VEIKDMKAKLIIEILRLNPCGAYNFKGKFIGDPMWHRPGGDWTLPYSKYVHCSQKFIGTTGVPSEATIYDTKYSWNKGLLLRASSEELLKLKEATIKENTMWQSMCDKYDNMGLLEFLGVLSSSAQSTNQQL